MTSCSSSPLRERCLSSALLCAVTISLFAIALFGSSAPSVWAAASPVAAPVNIGTNDDPYFVDDAISLEAMKASAIAQSSMATAINVVRLNNWTTGLTHTTAMGVNRCLVFVVAFENAGDVAVSAVTFGGQFLTRIGGIANSSGTRERTEIWYLNETGIVAAGSSAFVVTWGGSAPTSPKYAAATYGNVDQASSIVNHSGNSTNSSTPNPLATSVTVVAGGMALSGIMNGNTGSFTWNNSFVEAIDQSGSSSNLGVADRAEAAAGTTTASAKHSSATSRAMYAASLRPATSAGALDSINIGQVDLGLFPQVCAYFEALDAGGNPVGGLTADSFCVYQDSIRLNVFSVEQLTVDSCQTATCLVIDVSGSMGGAKMAAAKSAASSFVRNMDTFDRAAILKFSDCYSVVQNFTSDTTLLLSAISGLAAGGRTAHFDGVWAGVGLTIPELGSKAVINLTDGLENNSGACGSASTPDGLGDGFADDSALIVNLALGAGIPIYSITLGSGFDPQYAQKMAYATGGAYYHAPSPSQLDGIYAQIKERLCTRYKICYTSPDLIQNGDCHDVIICQQSMPNVCVNCDTAEYCEKAPPEIVRTPPTVALDNTCQPWNTQVQLCVWVTDDDTPLNQLMVNLFYRAGNVGPYTSVSTTRTDSTFCAYVPASVLVCGGDSIQYYFTASDGSVTIASPSNAPAGHHLFPICPNNPPVCNVQNDTTIVQCTPAQVCLPVSGTDVDGNFKKCEKQSGPGTLYGGQWCYTPAGDETVNVTIRCIDSCGLYCEESFAVTFASNDPPICGGSFPPPGSGDAPCDTVNMGDHFTVIFSGVSYSGTQSTWCYELIWDGADPELSHLTIELCNALNNSNLVSSSPTGASIGPDGLTGLYGIKWDSDDLPSITPNVPVSFCFTLNQAIAEAQTSFVPKAGQNETIVPICGPATNCEPYNPNPPVTDTTVFACSNSLTCIPISASDPNANIVGCTIISGPGTISGGNWCYTPSGDETVSVTIRCTDACGAYCEVTMNVTFVTNDAPVCAAVNDTGYVQCVPTPVCRPVSATDSNGNLTGCAVLSGPGTVSGGNWCYTPTGDETVNVTIRCTDACGAYCDESFSVTFSINDAPVCTPISDTNYFQCTPTQVCRPVSATDPNGNLTGCAVFSGPGTVSGGNWCYTSLGDETVNVTIRCTDACGAYCDESFSVTFSINDAPVCATVSDTTYFQCLPTPVCRPVSATDPNGNLTGCAIANGPGILSGGNWCYTPVGDETVNVTIRCTDGCGAYCEETFSVTFSINDAPVCATVNDTTIFQCAPTQVCIPVSATDPNGNLTGCAVLTGPGSVSGGNWCYTPLGDETVSVTIRCTDACGAYCDETFQVTFQINDAPACAPINDTTYFQCVPTQVCRAVSSTDPNGNLTGCVVVSGPGSVSGGNWCYTPLGDETVNVTIRCTDTCGVYCDESFSVTFSINDVPVCTPIADTSYFQCTPTQVCRPASSTDPNGNLVSCAIISGPGTLGAGNWCYTPSGDEIVNVTIRCTDACGVSCDESFSVTFQINDAPVCTPIADTSYFQCTPTQVCRPVSSTDPNGNLMGCSVLSGPGTVSGGSWCYTPLGDETVNVTIRCSDTCGVYCDESFSVTFEINDGPTINLGADISLPQNFNGDTVCFVYSVFDPNGLAGLIEMLVSAPSGTTIDTALNEICVPYSTSSPLEVIAKVTDPCGVTDYDTMYVLLFMTQPPVCNLPGDTSFLQCVPVQVCLPYSSTSLYPPVTCAITSGPGTLSGGNWCYTPGGDETVTVTIVCTDNLGATCSGTFSVVFDINDAPVCSVPADQTIFQCAPAQVCLPVSAADPNGNLSGCVITGGPGTLAGGNWCYAPAGDEAVSVTVRCTDACGLFCEKTFVITFDIDAAPVCSVPNDTTIFQCTPAPVCLPVSATDADGNLSGCVIVSGPGTLNGNWCYTPTGDETAVVTIRCTDACGAFCEKTFSVTFVINDPPVCSVPNDTTIFQCAPMQVCLPVSATDVDGNLTGCHVAVGPGVVAGGLWCYTPVASGVVSVTIECTDACGAFCDESFNVTFSIGNPPQISCAANQQVTCATLVPPCSPSDVTVIGGAGTVVVTCSSTNNGGTGCPASPRIYTYTYIATDSCGAQAQCSRTITVIDNVPPTLIGCPASVTYFCNEPVLPPPTVTATDNCDPVVPVTIEGSMNINACGVGTITRTWRATDDCGNTSTCTQVLTFVAPGPPVCSVPSGTLSFFQCTPAMIQLPVSAASPCGALLTCRVVSGPGVIVGPYHNGFWQYTPSNDESSTVTIRCADSCGNYCESSFNVNITLNDPPIIAFGPDQNVFECAPSQICVNYTPTDPNGLTGSTEALVSGPAGAVLNAGLNQVCFTPTGAGTYTIVASLTDSCGIADRDTINVTVSSNSAPTISFGADRSVFQCNAEQVCVDYTTADPNGNALTEALISGPSGALLDQVLNRVCFTPASSGIYTIIARVQDTCGATDHDTVVVTVTRNQPPIAIPPNDTTVSQCENAQICLPVSGFDPEGRPITITKISGPGTISNGQWCYNANSDQVLTITFRVTDSCGAFDDASFTVTFDLNDPPQCQVPGDMTIRQNCVPQQVSIPVGAIDPDGNLVECHVVSGPGGIVNGNWVYTPFGDGQVCVTIQCSDVCGATCQRSFCVYFEIDEDQCNCLLVVSIGDGDGNVQILSGQQVTVPVNIDSVTGPIGGFDFLICYDQSVLTFLYAGSADAIDGWEYFTYRYGPNGNCAGACPSGFVRLIGIANMNNGVQPPESVYYPIGSIAELVFQVSPDRNLINQCVPINFCWVDCGDNTISSRSGDTTWVDHLMIVDTCQSNAKTNPIPGICFSTGYVCIMEPPDDRGDINLNGIANEVGDAVLFTNYFIYGSNVWDPVWENVQILATDINDDGIVLTVADLIYLIRIITGDEQPFPPGTGTGSPKLSPYINSGSALVRVDDNSVTVSTSSSVDLGGALLVFRYSGLAVGAPASLDGGAGMNVRYHANAGELRVLIHPSWDGDWATIGAGHQEVLSIPTTGNGSIELVEVQLSDARGALLSTSAARAVVPTEYALLQNYPNPFNAGTIITFNLKEASEWTVTVYNVLGQVVRTFDGTDDANNVRVSWDGQDRDGSTVASGVYFYRVTTPHWNATRKMTLVR